ncbi:conserved hypothetical protein [Ricinus communis]|uniref:Uncharacterized protein n=1 Tax=Ricinus communis TaxID=3988 RepID=B9RV77_RICCO|nr:conserved hypothetical protein [Ricinus communis]
MEDTRWVFYKCLARFMVNNGCCLAEYMEAKKFLAMALVSVIFRQANTGAHSLAGASVDYASPTVWHLAPSFIGPMPIADD